jgi:hypothetical protein
VCCMIKENNSAANILDPHSRAYRNSCMGARLAMCHVGWTASKLLATRTSLICLATVNQVLSPCNAMRCTHQKVTGKSECSLALDTMPCRRW